jgi:hypothetical protein
MALTVTPSRRQIAMAVMLLLALSGGMIRKYAPNPSTLRDVGSLLLVMWLPAVGNLIGFLMRKIPRKAPPRTEFEANTAFAPHLKVQVEAPAVQAAVLEALDPAERKCTVLVGRHGFTARLAEPLKQTFAATGAQTLALELLHPAVALTKLSAGTEFHLLVATTGITKGRVVSQL